MSHAVELDFVAGHVTGGRFISHELLGWISTGNITSPRTSKPLEITGAAERTQKIAISDPIYMLSASAKANRAAGKAKRMPWLMKRVLLR
jgi:hypothetical protein